MESNTLFVQLAVILGLASVIGFGIIKLKLPLVVAYLLAGVALSVFGLTNSQHSETMTFLPEVGIAFVLFFVGMELDLKEIKHLGKQIIIASLGQIVISSLAGFEIASYLGFSTAESFYLGIGLSFSSTIVVIKMLLEKKDLNSLYGKLSVGIVLLEDLVAIVLLMILTVSNSMLNLGLQNNFPLIALILKGMGLLIISLVLSRYVLEKIFSAVAKSAELLFLSALAWCFIFVAISLLLGFSIVIGAFLAGIALANSPFHYEIQGKVKPLRDFFVTLFFVYLGTQVVFKDILAVWPLILIYTLYAVIVKPLVLLLILGASGFRKHTIFQTALNISQVSEFSLIVLMMGLKLGVVSQPVLTGMALVGVISIIISSIMITYSRKIYRILEPLIGFFERGDTKQQLENNKVELENHVILIGARYMGGEILRFLKRQGIPVVVVDFDPEVVKKLAAERTHVLYGDIGDPEVLEFLDLGKAKIVISTADSDEDNLVLVSELKRRNRAATIIIRAGESNQADALYKAGADYVILPDVVSGDFITGLLKEHWPNVNFFRDHSKTELNKLSKSHLAFK